MQTRCGRAVTSLLGTVIIPGAHCILSCTSHVQNVPTASALPLLRLVLSSPVTPGLWQRGHFPSSVSTTYLWGCLVPRTSTDSMESPPKVSSKLPPGSQSTALKASFPTCLQEATRLRVIEGGPDNQGLDSSRLCNPSAFTSFFFPKGSG